jgi:hypothetical protein
MRRNWLVTLSALALLSVAGTASAQVDAKDWHKGTALSVFGGGATSSSVTGGAGGAAIGWEVTPHITFEGSGVWMAGPDDAFAALAGSRVNLLRPRGVVPFVSGGIGLYRALPRVGPAIDDVVVSVGGGLDIYLRRHLALRPDVRLLVVNRDADVHHVSVFGLHLAYHFEDHPVTP